MHLLSHIKVIIILQSSVNSEVGALFVFIFLLFYCTFRIMAKYSGQIHKVFQNTDDIRGNKTIDKKSCAIIVIIRAP